jgi:geranylgeranyl diphosphate synthase type II
LSKEQTIQAYLAAEAAHIEAALAESLPFHWDIPAKLRESFQYSLMAGGKRLRPILVLAAAEALGGS